MVESGAKVGSERDAPVVWHVGGADMDTRIPLVLQLRNRGFDVAVVCPDRVETLEEHAIPAYRYTMKPWLSPSADLRALRQLRGLIREHRPDIVHAFTTKPALIVPFAARLNCPVAVQTITGRGYVFSDSSLPARLLRQVYSAAQRVGSRYVALTVFQTAEDRDCFLKAGLVKPGRAALVPGSGIDVDDFLSRTPGEPAQDRLRDELGLKGRTVVTMISRLLKEKGVKEFLRAAAEARKQAENLAFLLIGDSAQGRSRSISLSEVANSADAVQYLGRRKDIPAILALTDIFVLPTAYGEGIPRVLLEAGSMGIPLITTDLPGCRDVVKHGWNGILVRPRNVKDLVEAILTLQDSRRERDLMGRRSVTVIREKYSLDKVADAYARLYEGLLSHSSPETKSEDPTRNVKAAP